VVRDLETGEILGELLQEDESLVVARGGKGGRGNAAYATPTHQAPREWEPGEWGEERRVELELKLIADVGLVGEPNAGKSTLLSRVSAAHPKIASYPFTTLAPHLGVVQLTDGRSFVVADIPGIIEGAHEGKGLGTQFLRHIERTRSLALLVPIDQRDLQASYDLLRDELAAHNPGLVERPHCAVVTKSDLVPPEEREVRLHAPEAWGVFVLSSVTGEGLDALKEALWARVRSEKEKEREKDFDRFADLEEWVP
jgi:GTP-binding protein